MASLSAEVFLIVVATLISILTVAVGLPLGASYPWVKCATLVAIVVILILNGSAAVVQIRKASAAHQKEAAILERKGRLVALLGGEIDQASRIEYDMESLMTRGEMTQPALDGFVTRIETWRTQVGHQLGEVLPRTHASQIFLATRGEFPGSYVGVGRDVAVQVAQTPGFYQYTHVRECRHALTAILAAADSFARLSVERATE